MTETNVQTPESVAVVYRDIVRLYLDSETENNRLPDLMQDITETFSIDTDISWLCDAISNLRAAHELLLHAAYKFAPPDIEAEVIAECLNSRKPKARYSVTVQEGCGPCGGGGISRIKTRVAMPVAERRPA